MQQTIDILLWFSVLAAGLMAGLYFAFSVFIMRALGEIEPAAGIAAMNAISRVILRSAFMPLFLASSAASLALAGIGVWRADEAGSIEMAAAGAIYLLGMVAVTILRNVPLNDALAAVDPAREDSDRIWQGYRNRWTRWNHVRTVASTVALVLFILAIDAR